MHSVAVGEFSMIAIKFAMIVAKLNADRIYQY